jgi:hypothetical protein
MAIAEEFLANWSQRLALLFIVVARHFGYCAFADAVDSFGHLRIAI